MTRLTLATLVTLALANPALAFGGGATFELPTLQFPPETSTLSTQGDTAPACEADSAAENGCK